MVFELDNKWVACATSRGLRPWTVKERERERERECFFLFSFLFWGGGGGGGGAQATQLSICWLRCSPARRGLPPADSFSSLRNAKNSYARLMQMFNDGNPDSFKAVMMAPELVLHSNWIFQVLRRQIQVPGSSSCTVWLHSIRRPARLPACLSQPLRLRLCLPRAVSLRCCSPCGSVCLSLPPHFSLHCGPAARVYPSKDRPTLSHASGANVKSRA